MFIYISISQKRFREPVSPSRRRRHVTNTIYILAIVDYIFMQGYSLCILYVMYTYIYIYIYIYILIYLCMYVYIYIYIYYFILLLYIYIYIL